MSIEQAIGKAREAGFVTGFIYDRMAAVDPLGALEVIFFDRRFWQSLGKVMGWKEDYRPTWGECYACHNINPAPLGFSTILLAPIHRPSCGRKIGREFFR